MNRSRSYESLKDLYLESLRIKVQEVVQIALETPIYWEIKITKTMTQKDKNNICQFVWLNQMSIVWILKIQTVVILGLDGTVCLNH